MSSLLEHCHGEKTHFSRNEKRTFSLSQMNNVELARTLSWRENALFEERKEHVWGLANAFGDVVDCMCGSPLLMFDGKSTTKLTEQRNFSRAILCPTPKI